MKSYEKEVGKGQGVCENCKNWKRHPNPYPHVGKCSGQVMNGLTNRMQTCSEYDPVPKLTKGMKHANN